MFGTDREDVALLEGAGPAICGLAFGKPIPPGRDLLYERHRWHRPWNYLFADRHNGLGISDFDR